MSDTTATPYIVETTEATFEQDVIERSLGIPVVVDFGAAWCQPCRLLGPILEGLAREFKGAFVLVKADTEAMPNVAAAFRLQSIPAVFAVKDGRAIDSFLGLLPEPAIRAWIERLMPTPAEQKIAEVRRVEATDPAAAERLYREALALTPNDPVAKIRLGRFLLSQNRLEETQTLITSLEERGFLEPEAEKLKAELSVRLGAKDAGEVAPARAAAAAHPDDFDLRFKLAEALAAAGQSKEALELGLSIVEEGPKDLREACRKLMVSLFQILPDDDEVAAEYRRKLSAALY